MRCSYKNDFNAFYPLYCQLKNRLDEVMNEFQILEERWKEAEGTVEEDVSVCVCVCVCVPVCLCVPVCVCVCVCV